jgi:putative ABC transport system substrate-binding protein
MKALPGLVQELVTAKAEVIVTFGFKPTLAAKETGIPIVAANGIGDPVATGLIQSLAHPGGSITGISDSATELTVKRLGFLKEIVPSLHRVAMIWNEDDLGMKLRARAAIEAAEKLGVSVHPLGSITGHSAREVQAILDAHYLGGKAELARQAMAKLAAFFSARKAA